jgi:hypothetical protein
MKPINIVAVGKIAFKKLDALGEHPTYVRHPSKGGNAEFAYEMQYAFKDNEEKY